MCGTRTSLAECSALVSEAPGAASGGRTTLEPRWLRMAPAGLGLPAAPPPMGEAGKASTSGCPQGHQQAAGGNDRRFLLIMA